jgi:hypothetical protein
MFYAILKAITNFQCGPNLTSVDYIDNHIYMTVYSFGCVYGISIYNDHVNVELLKEIDPSYKPKLYPITKPEYLCVIYSLLKICRKDLYDRLFSKVDNKYDISYLKNNLDKMSYNELREEPNIYLAIFALLDIPEEGGCLILDGQEVTLKYHESDLDLIPFGVDWAYMGRGLWLKMCKIIADNKK